MNTRITNSATALMATPMYWSAYPASLSSLTGGSASRLPRLWRAPRTIADTIITTTVSTRPTDAVKAGTFVTTPSTYLVANSATEEPAYLWEMTSIEGNLAGSRTIDQAVEQSDLVIMTKKSCDVNSFVVVETDDTVAIGIELVVPTVPGIPKPSAAPTVEVLERVCGSAPIGSPGSYYFVNLRGGPLGDRTVTTLDGEPVPQDADPASR